MITDMAELPLVSSVIEFGSGTGIKPPYSAIPLTNAEHQMSHDRGDSAIGDENWWAKMRIKYVSQWAYEKLKANMGYDSYTDMPPHQLVEWASQRELTQHLPLSYINAQTKVDEKADNS